MSLSSCSSISSSTNKTSASFLAKQFKKICLEGSGKGRIELVGSKYTFGFESQLQKSENRFDLALDFPIFGETKVSLSLTPKDVSKQMKHSELIDLLKEQLGDRSDREEITKTIEEFFVFSSDFINYKARDVYPAHFISSYLNDHFLLSRETGHYLYSVDNFQANEVYFERTVFRIFLKSRSFTDPIMTLFLVPQSCDK